MASRVWSPVEDSFLLDNLAVLTLKDLGADLKVSQRELRTRLDELNIKKPRIQKVPRSQNGPTITLSRLCQNPLCRGVFEVSAYDVNRGRGTFCSRTCSAMRKRLDVPDKETLEKDYLDGMSSNDLAVKYNMSSWTVLNLFKAYGIRVRSAVEAQDVAAKQKPRAAENAKSGFREDLGVLCRSGWEANSLRWLSSRGVSWEYEPKRFHFPETRGAKSYLPDFYLPEYEGSDRWVEVKGWLRSSDKTRIKRFRKHHPEEFQKLMAIPGGPKTEAALFFDSLNVPILAYYSDLEKEFKGKIAHWGE